MKRLLALAGAAALVSVGIAAGLVTSDVAAEGGPKVFVCKYVGTPGPSERLQTGDNPISVSANSIKDWNGENPGNLIGLEFADAQGFSRVIAIDTGQAEPSCEGLPPTTEVTPTAPTFQDPTCELGADITIPEVTGVEYTVEGKAEPGKKVEVTAKPEEGYAFPAGATTSWEHTFGNVPEDCGPREDVFAAQAVCDFENEEYDVSGTVNGDAAQVKPKTIAGDYAGSTTVEVKLGEAVSHATVTTDGKCVGESPPPPPPPHEVTGAAAVSCILPDGYYRVSGTVDGHPADKVDPATVPGHTKGSTEVTVTRGDTSVKTTVSTNGDCGNAPTPPEVTPPAVTTAPVPTTPTTPTTPSEPTAPLTPPTPKKPAVKKPAAKPAPASPTKAVAGAVAKEPPKLAYTP